MLLKHQMHNPHRGGIIASRQSEGTAERAAESVFGSGALFPPFANVYDDLVARIRSGGAGISAPKPGEKMPSFVLPDSQN